MKGTLSIITKDGRCKNLLINLKEPVSFSIGSDAINRFNYLCTLYTYQNLEACLFLIHHYSNGDLESVENVNVTSNVQS